MTPAAPTDTEIAAARARAEHAIGMRFDGPEYDAVGVAHRCLSRIARLVNNGVYAQCVGDVARAIVEAGKAREPVAVAPAAGPDERILIVPAAIRAELHNLLNTEIGRLLAKSRQGISSGRRRALEARADGLRRLADELAR